MTAASRIAAVAAYAPALQAALAAVNGLSPDDLEAMAIGEIEALAEAVKPLVANGHPVARSALRHMDARLIEAASPADERIRRIGERVFRFEAGEPPTISIVSPHNSFRGPPEALARYLAARPLQIAPEAARALLAWVRGLMNAHAAETRQARLAEARAALDSLERRVAEERLRLERDIAMLEGLPAP